MYDPRAQEHVELPATLLEPAGHGLQASRPAPSAKVSAGQVVHAGEPVEAAAVPAAHGRHAVDERLD